MKELIFSWYAMGELLIATNIQLSYKLVMGCLGQVITMPRIPVWSWQNNLISPKSMGLTEKNIYIQMYLFAV